MRCYVRCRACDAPGRDAANMAGSDIGGSDHQSFMMRTFYDARLHVLMRDGNNRLTYFRRSSYNISSRLDRVIAADQQQQFVMSSAVSSLFIITDIIARSSATRERVVAADAR